MSVVVSMLRFSARRGEIILEKDLKVENKNTLLKYNINILFKMIYNS
jgi:hypothetical protein